MTNRSLEYRREMKTKSLIWCEVAGNIFIVSYPIVSLYGLNAPFAILLGTMPFLSRHGVVSRRWEACPPGATLSMPTGSSGGSTGLILRGRKCGSELS